MNLGNGKKREFISVATSKDGINFKKHENNPIIKEIPPQAHERQFRDPAVTCIDGRYYCIIAAGKKEKMVASLLLYESDDLLRWEYKGPIVQYEGCYACECPSFMKFEEGYLLTSSVIVKGDNRRFTAMYGDFDGSKFTPKITSEIHKGPDQYAGQAFTDHLGRHLFMTWIPGWSYSDYCPVSIGCLSLPVEIKRRGDKLLAYPIEEVRYLLKKSDPALEITDDGFVVKREDREDLVYKGKIRDIAVMRDNYVLEIYVNGGEEIYTAILC
jgi:beta-fructofuranosidase